MKEAGIYVIRRIGTDQCYVGSSSNVHRRWTAHRRELRQGTHHAQRLLNAWAKYGEDSFEFAMLELVNGEGVALRDALLLREQAWMDKLRPCFNTVPAAGSTLGFKMPREVVERHRQQLTGRRAPPAEAERLRALALGVKRGPETVEKLRQAGLRRGMPIKAIENSAAARRGKPLAPEHVEKVRATSTGRKHSLEVLERMRASNTPEVRLAKGAAARGKAQSPEHRAKRIAALVAYHERRRNGLAV